MSEFTFLAPDGKYHRVPEGQFSAAYLSGGVPVDVIPQVLVTSPSGTQESKPHADAAKLIRESGYKLSSTPSPLKLYSPSDEPAFVAPDQISRALASGGKLFPTEVAGGGEIQPELPKADDAPASLPGWIGPVPRDPTKLRHWDRYQAIIKANERGRAGFLEGINPASRDVIPFVGSALETIEAGKVLLTARKMRDGKPVTDQEVLDLNLYLADLERQDAAKLWGKAGRVIRDSAVFGFELGASLIAAVFTAGAAPGSTIATKLAAKAAKSEVDTIAKRALKYEATKSVKDYLNLVTTKGFANRVVRPAVKEFGQSIMGKTALGQLERTGKNIVSKTAGKVAARTAGGIADMAVFALPATIAQTGFQSFATMLAGQDPGTVRGTQDKLFKTLMGEDDSDVGAGLWYGIADQLIENFSEASGGYIMGGISKVAGRPARALGGGIGKWLDDMAKYAAPEGKAPTLATRAKSMTALASHTVNKMRDWAANYSQTMDLFRQMGYDGVLGEMMEERAGDFARGLFGLQGDADDNAIKRAIKNSIPDLEQVGVELIAFSAPMAFGLATPAVLGGSGMRDVMSKTRQLQQGLHLAQVNREGQRTALTDERATVPMLKSVRKQRKDWQDADELTGSVMKAVNRVTEHLGFKYVPGRDNDPAHFVWDVEEWLLNTQSSPVVHFMDQAEKLLLSARPNATSKELEAAALSAGQRLLGGLGNYIVLRDLHPDGYVPEEEFDKAIDASTAQYLEEVGMIQRDDKQGRYFLVDFRALSEEQRNRMFSDRAEHLKTIQNFLSDQEAGTPITDAARKEYESAQRRVDAINKLAVTGLTPEEIINLKTRGIFTRVDTRIKPGDSVTFRNWYNMAAGTADHDGAEGTIPWIWDTYLREGASALSQEQLDVLIATGLPGFRSSQDDWEVIRQRDLRAFAWVAQERAAGRLAIAGDTIVHEPSGEMFELAGYAVGEGDKNTGQLLLRSITNPGRERTMARNSLGGEFKIVERTGERANIGNFRATHGDKYFAGSLDEVIERLEAHGQLKASQKPAAPAENASKAEKKNYENRLKLYRAAAARQAQRTGRFLDKERKNPEYFIRYAATTDHGNGRLLEFNPAAILGTYGTGIIEDLLEQIFGPRPNLDALGIKPALEAALKRLTSSGANLSNEEKEILATLPRMGGERFADLEIASKFVNFLVNRHIDSPLAEAFQLGPVFKLIDDKGGISEEELATVRTAVERIIGRDYMAALRFRSEAEVGKALGRSLAKKQAAEGEGAAQKAADKKADEQASAKQAANKPAAAKQEAPKQEAPKQEAPKQEAPKQTAKKPLVPKKTESTSAAKKPLVPKKAEAKPEPTPAPAEPEEITDPDEFDELPAFDALPAEPATQPAPVEPEEITDPDEFDDVAAPLPVRERQQPTDAEKLSHAERIRQIKEMARRNLPPADPGESAAIIRKAEENARPLGEAESAPPEDGVPEALRQQLAILTPMFYDLVAVGVMSERTMFDELIAEVANRLQTDPGAAAVVLSQYLARDFDEDAQVSDAVAEPGDPEGSALLNQDDAELNQAVRSEEQWKRLFSEFTNVFRRAMNAVTGGRDQLPLILDLLRDSKAEVWRELAGPAPGESLPAFMHSSKAFTEWKDGIELSSVGKLADKKFDEASFGQFVKLIMSYLPYTHALAAYQAFSFHPIDSLAVSVGADGRVYTTVLNTNRNAIALEATRRVMEDLRPGSPGMERILEMIDAVEISRSKVSAEGKLPASRDYLTLLLQDAIQAETRTPAQRALIDDAAELFSLLVFGESNFKFRQTLIDNFSGANGEAARKDIYLRLNKLWPAGSKAANATGLHAFIGARGLTNRAEFEASLRNHILVWFGENQESVGIGSLSAEGQFNIPNEFPLLKLLASASDETGKASTGRGFTGASYSGVMPRGRLVSAARATGNPLVRIDELRIAEKKGLLDKDEKSAPFVYTPAKKALIQVRHDVARGMTREAFRRDGLAGSGFAVPFNGDKDNFYAITIPFARFAATPEALAELPGIGPLLKTKMEDLARKREALAQAKADGKPFINLQAEVDQAARTGFTDEMVDAFVDYFYSANGPAESALEAVYEHAFGPVSQFEQDSDGKLAFMKRFSLMTTPIGPMFLDTPGAIPEGYLVDMADGSKGVRMLVVQPPPSDEGPEFDFGDGAWYWNPAVLDQLTARGFLPKDLRTTKHNVAGVHEGKGIIIKGAGFDPRLFTDYVHAENRGEISLGDFVSAGMREMRAAQAINIVPTPTVKLFGNMEATGTRVLDFGAKGRVPLLEYVIPLSSFGKTMDFQVNTRLYDQPFVLQALSGVIGAVMAVQGEAAHGPINTMLRELYGNIEQAVAAGMTEEALRDRTIQTVRQHYPAVAQHLENGISLGNPIIAADVTRAILREVIGKRAAGRRLSKVLALNAPVSASGKGDSYDASFSIDVEETGLIDYDEEGLPPSMTPAGKVKFRLANGLEIDQYRAPDMEIDLPVEEMERDSRFLSAVNRRPNLRTPEQIAAAIDNELVELDTPERWGTVAPNYSEAKTRSILQSLFRIVRDLSAEIPLDGSTPFGSNREEAARYIAHLQHAYGIMLDLSVYDHATGQAAVESPRLSEQESNRYDGFSIRGEAFHLRRDASGEEVAIVVRGMVFAINRVPAAGGPQSTFPARLGRVRKGAQTKISRKNVEQQGADHDGDGEHNVALPVHAVAAFLEMYDNLDESEIGLGAASDPKKLLKSDSMKVFEDWAKGHIKKEDDFLRDGLRVVSPDFAIPAAQAQLNAASGIGVIAVQMAGLMYYAGALKGFAPEGSGNKLFEGDSPIKGIPNMVFRTDNSSIDAWTPWRAKVLFDLAQVIVDGPKYPGEVAMLKLHPNTIGMFAAALYAAEIPGQPEDTGNPYDMVLRNSVLPLAAFFTAHPLGQKTYAEAAAGKRIAIYKGTLGYLSQLSNEIAEYAAILRAAQKTPTEGLAGFEDRYATYTKLRDGLTEERFGHFSNRELRTLIPLSQLSEDHPARRILDLTMAPAFASAGAQLSPYDVTANNAYLNSLRRLPAGPLSQLLFNAPFRDVFEAIYDRQAKLYDPSTFRVRTNRKDQVTVALRHLYSQTALASLRAALSGTNGAVATADLQARTAQRLKELRDTPEYRDNEFLHNIILSNVAGRAGGTNYRTFRLSRQFFQLEQPDGTPGAMQAGFAALPMDLQVDIFDLVLRNNGILRVRNTFLQAVPVSFMREFDRAVSAVQRFYETNDLTAAPKGTAQRFVDNLFALLGASQTRPDMLAVEGISLEAPAVVAASSGESSVGQAVKVASYGDMVTELGPDDVFVFGSNLQGFHGAGSAGYASFGRAGNHWREEGYAERPAGWQGKWNVKGQGEGLQQGTEGTSYALPTVTRAGAKRSRTPDQIIESIRKLYDTARQNPSKRFLVAGGTSGTPLNGYSHEELTSMFAEAGPVPANVLFSDTYAPMVASRSGINEAESAETIPESTDRESAAIIKTPATVNGALQWAGHRFAHHVLGIPIERYKGKTLPFPVKEKIKAFRARWQKLGDSLQAILDTEGMPNQDKVASVRRRILEAKEAKKWPAGVGGQALERNINSMLDKHYGTPQKFEDLSVPADLGANTAVQDELARGVDPAVLRDIGYSAAIQNRPTVTLAQVRVALPKPMHAFLQPPDVAPMVFTRAEARNMLQVAATHTSSPVIKALIEEVLLSGALDPLHGKALKFRVTLADGLDSDGGILYGVYDNDPPGGGEVIELFAPSIMSKRSPRAQARMFSYTFLHEYMHALTVNSLAVDPVFNAEIRRLREAIAPRVSLDEYGLQNNEEFVAELFTNKHFQLAAMNTPDPRGRSIWQRFLDALRAAFATRRGEKLNIPNSVFDQGVAVVVRAMTNAAGTNDVGYSAAVYSPFAKEMTTEQAEARGRVASPDERKWMQGQMLDHSVAAAKLNREADQSGAMSTLQKAADEGYLAQLYREALSSLPSENAGSSESASILNAQVDKPLENVPSVVFGDDTTLGTYNPAPADLVPVRQFRKRPPVSLDTGKLADVIGTTGVRVERGNPGYSVSEGVISVASMDQVPEVAVDYLVHGLLKPSAPVLDSPLSDLRGLSKSVRERFADKPMADIIAEEVLRRLVGSRSLFTYAPDSPAAVLATQLANEIEDGRLGRLIREAYVERGKRGPQLTFGEPRQLYRKDRADQPAPAFTAAVNAEELLSPLQKSQLLKASSFPEVAQLLVGMEETFDYNRDKAAAILDAAHQLGNPYLTSLDMNEAEVIDFSASIATMMPLSDSRLQILMSSGIPGMHQIMLAMKRSASAAQLDAQAWNNWNAMLFGDGGVKVAIWDPDKNRWAGKFSHHGYAVTPKELQERDLGLYVVRGAWEVRNLKWNSPEWRAHEVPIGLSVYKYGADGSVIIDPKTKKPMTIRRSDKGTGPGKITLGELLDNWMKSSYRSRLLKEGRRTEEQIDLERLYNETAQRFDMYQAWLNEHSWVFNGREVVAYHRNYNPGRYGYGGAANPIQDYSVSLLYKAIKAASRADSLLGAKAGIDPVELKTIGWNLGGFKKPEAGVIPPQRTQGQEALMVRLFTPAEMQTMGNTMSVVQANRLIEKRLHQKLLKSMAKYYDDAPDRMGRDDWKPSAQEAQWISTLKHLDEMNGRVKYIGDSPIFHGKVFETMAEAYDFSVSINPNAPLLPDTHDPFKVMSRYAFEGFTATLNRVALSSFLTVTDATGMPMVMAAPKNEEELTNGAIPERVWRDAANQWASYFGVAPVNTSLSLLSEVNRIYDAGQKAMAPTGAKTFTSARTPGIQQWWAADRKSAQLLNHLVQIPFTETHETAKMALRIVQWTKLLSVGFSLFFFVALGESSISASGLSPSKKGIRRNLAYQFLARPFDKQARQDWKRFKEGVKQFRLAQQYYNPQISMRTRRLVEHGMKSRTPSAAIDPLMGAPYQAMDEWVENVRQVHGDKAANTMRTLLVGAPITTAGERKYGGLVNMWPGVFGRRFSDFMFGWFSALKEWQAEYIMVNAALDAGHKADTALLVPHETARTVTQYVNETLGGNDWHQLVWATPNALALLNLLMFAPQWTYAAWMSSGGGILTSRIFKTYYAPGEWPFILGSLVSMYLIVMKAIPAAMQAAFYGVAAALGKADPDDKILPWNNEPTRRQHVDITPFARMLPWYKGEPTGNRRIYLQFAKQIHETGILNPGGARGWINEPFDQLGRKLSMPAKIVIEQFFGRSPGSDWDLEFNGKGPAGLFTSGEPGLKGPLTGRLGYIAQKAVPISFSTLITRSETAPFNFFAPTSRGASQSTIVQAMTDVLETYASRKDWQRIRKVPRARQRLADLMPELMDAARKNGYDPDKALATAKGIVLGRLYADMWRALNKNDVAGMNQAASAIFRAGGSTKGLASSLSNKSRTYQRPVTDEQKLLAEEAVRRAFDGNW